MTSRQYKWIRAKRFKVVDDPDHVFKFKQPGCPICNGKISVTVTGWERDKWGWIPVDIEIECTTAPDIDNEEWEEWHTWHYQQPYSDWLPLQIRIEEWMRKKVRFSTLKNKTHEKDHHSQK